MKVTTKHIEHTKRMIEHYNNPKNMRDSESYGFYRGCLRILEMIQED